MWPSSHRFISQSTRRWLHTPRILSTKTCIMHHQRRVLNRFYGNGRRKCISSNFSRVVLGFGTTTCLILAASQLNEDNVLLQAESLPPSLHDQSTISLQELPQYFKLEKLLSKSKDNHHHSFILRNKITGELAILNLWYNSEELAPEGEINAMWDAWEASCVSRPLSSSPPFQIHLEHPSNDKYRRFSSHWTTNQKLDFELIYPASQWDILKATPRKDYILQESAELYHMFTKPKFIDSIAPRREQWIFNILNGTAEAEDVIAQNDEFLLLPSPHFRSGRREDFKGLVFFRNDSDRLRSIRDLDGSDVELLERAEVFVAQALREKFNIPPSRYRLFFHYYPSFWRIHLHVSPVFAQSGHSSLLADRARNLHEIIHELKKDSDYCKNATFSIMVNDPQMVETLILHGYMEADEEDNF
mmetsp:Transcript_10916/g.40707  ORF Transcript_10916/g.40707 Transcript_10916/m.40707 type:complete len:416 (-) Transcript_10916:77-1324(-)